MIHIKFYVPAINISDDRENRHFICFFFFLSNYALLSIMNAHKFAFQNLYVLGLKPTTKTHWESQGKMMSDEMILNTISI